VGNFVKKKPNTPAPGSTVRRPFSKFDLLSKFHLRDEFRFPALAVLHLGLAEGI
jgi:hypothetical protein